MKSLLSILSVALSCMFFAACSSSENEQAAMDPQPSPAAATSNPASSSAHAPSLARARVLGNLVKKFRNVAQSLLILLWIKLQERAEFRSGFAFLRRIFPILGCFLLLTLAQQSLSYQLKADFWRHICYQSRAVRLLLRLISTILCRCCR